MASYSAVIDLRVTGQSGLDAVKNRLDAINSLIKNVKPVPSLFDRRANAEILRAKDLLADVVKKYAEGGQASARFATSIAGINQQLQAFKTVANNAKVGTDEFKDALTAAALGSNRLLRAELERAQELQNVYTKTSFATKKPTSIVADLLALKNTVPNSVAALERYQQELADVQRSVSMTSTEFEELGVAINQVDALLGKVEFGPVAPPKGNKAGKGSGMPAASGPTSSANPLARKAAMQENLMLGAGFPLLFGGGPAQVAGGVLGSFVGTGFGGQILGAALAQQLADALMRVKEIGSAAKQINMDSLRDSLVYVNAALEDSVRLLVEAGKSEKARAILIEEAAAQLALTPAAMQDINNATNALTAEWDMFVGAASGALSILGAPFAAALAGILRGVTVVLTGFNTLATLIGSALKGIIDWGLKLLGLKKPVDDIGASFGRISEEEEKLAAALTADIDKSQRQLIVQKEILDLEKKRTLGYTQLDRLKNIDIDKSQKIKEIEAAAEEQKIALRKQYQTLTKATQQQELQTRLKQIDGEKAMNIEAANLNAKRQIALELLNKMYIAEQQQLSLLRQQQTAIDGRIATLNTVASITGARITAEQQLNSLQKTQLEREYQFAQTADKRYMLAVAIFKNEAEAAALAYQQSLASIDIEILKNKLLLDRSVLKGYEILAEGKLQILQAKTAEEEERKKQALNDALIAQNAVIRGSAEQLVSSQLIGTYLKQAAGYQYQTSIAAAGTALQQKLVSDSIGMSSLGAQRLTNNLIAGYTSTEAMNNIAGNLSTKMAESASSLETGTNAVMATTTQFATAAVTATGQQDAWRESVLASVAAQDKAARSEAAVAYAAQEAVKVKVTAYQAAVKAALKGDKAIADSSSNTHKAVKTGWTLLVDSIKGLFRGLVSGLVSNLNKAIGFINSVIDRNNALPTPPFPDYPRLGYLQVPAFAEGGIVNKPTFAMVGEGGEPEYIIPQSKMATAASNYLAGGRGANIMNGSTGGDAPVVNIQTGPVLEFGGERYVTMQDFNMGLQQVADSVYRGLRKPSVRAALRI